MLKASKEIIQKIPRQRNILLNQVPKGPPRHKAIGCSTLQLWLALDPVSWQISCFEHILRALPK